MLKTFKNQPINNNLKDFVVDFLKILSTQCDPKVVLVATLKIIQNLIQNCSRINR